MLLRSHKDPAYHGVGHVRLKINISYQKTVVVVNQYGFMIVRYSGIEEVEVKLLSRV